MLHENFNVMDAEYRVKFPNQADSYRVEGWEKDDGLAGSVSSLIGRDWERSRVED
jgi:hypothetical protein